ncbi:TPA: hypothetical protein L5A09_006580 [Pseudomonas aeruginosa]|nr:hypothetical protein [Pseudomonas aeruginosa]
MNDMNPGLTIEGFVRGSYERIFDKQIEVRHHPLTNWAQADVSGGQHNFPATKEHVMRTLNGLQHALYHEGDKDDLLNELSEFESTALASSTVTELATAITEARPILDRAFERPGNQESE